MDKQYYTPDFSEFHIGFEYEVKLTRSTANTAAKEVWEKCKLGTRSKGEDILKGEAIKNNVCFIDNLLPIISSGYIRTKYLDKADIESLGFEFYKIFAGTLITVYENKDYELWYNDEKNHISVAMKGEGDVTLFTGKIRNKSELKRILKQIGIIK